MAKNTILGLDIGSSSIKAVIAEPNRDGKMVLVRGIVKPSKGIRRGVVVDMDAATGQINSIIQSVKDVSKDAVKNIYINISGTDVHSQISRGSGAVSRASSEIYKDDIERVVKTSEAVNLPSNRMIIHTINREYIVDGVGDIQDPLGMVGSRLEVVNYIIDAFAPAVKNIIKCVEIVGGEVSAPIFSPLASNFSVLTNAQRELGVILIDVGYNTTGIAIYEEGKLIYTKMLPVGAGHVTNDIGIALKVPIEIAEKIKLNYGYAVASGVPAKESVDLKDIDINLKGSPSKKFIAEVIESRLSEICDLINEELKRVNRFAKLPGGAVIVGGGAKLPGITELFKTELKLSTQIGLANPSFFESGVQNTADFLESPEYTCVLGLIVSNQELDSKTSISTDGIVSKVAGFLKNFLP